MAGSHDLAGISCPRTMRHVPPGPGAGQASAQCRPGGGEVAPGSPGGGVVRAQDPLPAGQGPLQQRDRPGGPARLPKSRGSNGKQHRQRDTRIMKIFSSRDHFGGRCTRIARARSGGAGTKR